MNKLLIKKITVFIMVFTMIISFFAIKNAVFAGVDETLWGGTTNKGSVHTNLGAPVEKDPRAVVAGIINILLGFLGIFAVVLIIWGGFEWMTSGGDSGKVDKAVGRIKNGAIGLAIILSAYSLAVFITDKIYTATTQ